MRNFFIEPMTRIELVTSSLPRKRSTPELHRRLNWKWAGDEGRTRDIQLGRLTLYQLSYSRLFLSVGRAGFEPAKVKPTDLQSVLVGRLSISPTFRADGGIRTPDQLITNQLLWPTELHRQICWYTKKRTYSFPNCLILGLQMYETFFYHKLF